MTADPFRCICPLDPTDLVNGYPRAVKGCPAHRSRHAAQQYAIRTESVDTQEHPMTDLNIEQPMPTPNTSVSVQSLVRADLETRERIGIQRYGTPLQPHNGRDALRDAYEEALDLACYLRQAIEERA